MTCRLKFKNFAVLAVLFVAIVTAGAMYVSHANRNSAIATATVWARLAPLPHSARNLQVEVKGSMFTREFVITFDASPAVIQQWLASSPGPASASPTVGGAITTYAITPGGGAGFAEVTVDHGAGRVVIRTYWS
jgi:hypothetical protein